MQIFSFPPIVNSESRILILGTMPGKESLKLNQYYAHSRNAFWKIFFHLFDEPFSTDYKIRQVLLLNNTIALWDVLKVCERESSLDTDILEEEPNDLAKFFEKYPKIDHLIFNGKYSRTYFMKYFPGSKLPYTIVSSTSPAHAVSIEKKIKEWSVIKEIINNTK